MEQEFGRNTCVLQEDEKIGSVKIADDVVAIGEVGLTGEIRNVSHINQRLQEVSRLGFKKCVIPRGSAEKLDIPDGLTVYRVRNIREAIEAIL